MKVVPKVEINGEMLGVSDAARRLGVKPNTLLYRIKRGWSNQRAVSGEKKKTPSSRGARNLDAIAKDRLAGMTTLELAAKYGFNCGHISRLCKRAGVVRKVSTKHDRSDEIRNLRLRGLSCIEISKTTGISVSAVCNHLKKMGFSKLPPKPPRVLTDCEINRRREAVRAWRRANGEALSYRIKNRMKSDPIYALKVRIRAITAQAIRRRKYEKAKKTREMLGCDWECLVKHIESQFCDGMGWHNMNRWHIDHIIPLSSAKTEKEIIELAHYKNLQPLWARDNLSKGAKYEKKNICNGSV